MTCPCCKGRCLAISQGKPKKTWVCVEGNCTWTETEKDCNKKHQPVQQSGSVAQ